MAKATKNTKAAVEATKRLVLGTIMRLDTNKDGSNQLKDHSELGRDYSYIFNFEVRVVADSGVIYYEIATYDDCAIKAALGKTVDLEIGGYVRTSAPLRKGMKVKVEGNHSQKPFTYTKGEHKGQTVLKDRLTVYNAKDISQLQLTSPFIDLEAPPVEKPKTKTRSRTPV